MAAIGVSGPQRHRALDRSIERSTIGALVPIITLLPVWLLALVVFWLPVRLVWAVPFWMFALAHLVGVVVMFVRPLQTVLVMRMLGARRANAEQARRLEPAWRSVAQQLGISPHRYALAVLPSEQLNAFACGGSLLVVTAYAIAALPRDEMTGVLAHELAHHLGLHTVALTIRQWLSLPIFLLAEVGFFLQNVATAATNSFVSHSSALSAVGRFISAILFGFSWIFLSGLLLSNRIANRAGRASEYEADRRAVAMGFGRELATALRRVDQESLRVDRSAERPMLRETLLEGLRQTHPSARSRVQRIEALRRRAAEQQRSMG
ncbi:MAG: M48 family metalloprotease [Ilumatobacteraceae bacterium]